jgi:orotate phosphoribosyltransferase
VTTLDGEGAALVGNAVCAVLDPSVVAVGGMTMGADPIAVATAITATAAGRPLRAFSVRKEAKGHGTGGRIVGEIGRGDRVAVVEDTTTTGGALLDVVAVLAEAGAEIVQVIALVDRSDGRVGEVLAGRGLRYTALLTPGDLGVGP